VPCWLLNLRVPLPGSVRLDAKEAPPNSLLTEVKRPQALPGVESSSLRDLSTFFSTAVAGRN